MSLDIAILDEQGAPAEGIAVTPENHFQLIKQAERLQLGQLLRMHSYYQDVDYTAQETSLLYQETETLVAQCNGEPVFCALLESVQSLIRHAVKDNKAVVAIAD